MIAATLLALSIAAPLAKAQNSLLSPTGNPSAATGQVFNQPTISWSQWQPKPTYAYEDLPDKYMGDDRAPPTESGYQWDQTGYNRCLQGEGSWNVNATCQTGWINSATDFCIFGPPRDGIEVGAFEREAVAYCTAPTHGTRLIPEGTLNSVHFVQTVDYVQVTGMADFTKIGFVDGDSGGEMDSAGMDDLSNPIGGVMYTTAKPGSRGEPTQLLEWTNFMSYNQFCIRGCWGRNAEAQCQHRYDVLGCVWNIPANYGEGFETCEGANAMLQGVYGSSTFEQGDPSTPPPHPAPSSSRCTALSSVGNGGVLLAPGRAPASVSTSSSSVVSPSSSSSGSSRPSSIATSRTSNVVGAVATSGSQQGATSGAAIGGPSNWAFLAALSSIPLLALLL